MLFRLAVRWQEKFKFYRNFSVAALAKWVWVAEQVSEIKNEKKLTEWQFEKLLIMCLNKKGVLPHSNYKAINYLLLDIKIMFSDAK